MLLLLAPHGVLAQLPCVPSEQWSHAADSCGNPVVARLTDDDGNGRVDADDDLDVATWSTVVEGITPYAHALGLDGATGGLHFDRRTLQTSHAGLAAGDLDRDGVADLLIASPQRLARLDARGGIVWERAAPMSLDRLPFEVGLADLDQDGVPEIHVGPAVWDPNGTLLWTGARSSGLSMSSAADVVGASPGMELAVGRVLYAADGTVLWEAKTEPEGPTAIGDLDGDLEPEVVLLAHEERGVGTVTLLDAAGNLVGTRFPLGRRSEQVPVLADIDGDGLPEVVVVPLGEPGLALAFDGGPGGLSLLWETTLSDGDPGVPRAFDFDGDGAAEILIRTNELVLVLDGATGAEIDSIPTPSATAGEAAVIADIDADGVTELVVPACENARAPDPEVRAYQCASACLARAAWNQVSYRIGNVGLDGTIPRFEPPPWLSHGTWGAQGGTGPCDLHCDAAVAPPLPDFETCAGESVTLDASGHDIRDCDGTVTRTWSDETGTPLGTGPTLEVAPLTTTRYRVDLTCSTRPSCRLADAATVHVSQRPDLGPATATDVAPCNRGVEITWPEADFTSGSGGTYSIYRSDLPTGGTCEDALAQPALATGLTGTSWFDADTLPGVAHVWVVEAEDAQPAGGCRPAGPDGGAVDRSCTAPLEDRVDLDPPEGVFATLRVERDGAENRARWSDARALLSGEHFHLHRSDDPRVFGPIVNPEGDTAREHLLDAEPVPLRVFDLRVADVCERESPDEFPPGWDVP